MAEFPASQAQLGAWRSWRLAMHGALYGPAGFYRTVGAPGRHFRTSAHTSSSWAVAIGRLAESVDEDLDQPPDFTFVDMGAGGGELLSALAETAPRRWRLLGVDVAPRPAGLSARVEWAEEMPAGFDGVLLAVEWLDVVPVDCVELTDDGARLIEVNEAGGERIGAPPAAADAQWLGRWWPLADVGDRAEIGRSRDEAWTAALAHLRRGLAVAVDYAADPRRDVAGTLTGYRQGRQVLPVPDGSMDLTAHVLFESLAAGSAGNARLVTQREALLALGLTGDRPSYDDDPSAYVAALAAAGVEAELMARGGLGEHRWLMIERHSNEER